MKRIDAYRAGRTQFPEDVRLLRENVPALGGLSNHEIDELYRLWSDREYAAQWMIVAPGLVEDGPVTFYVAKFAEWLEDDVEEWTT